MPLQRRARDNEVLENLVRHLGSLSIDLDDEEIELESTGPDISDRVGVSNVEVCSTIDLTEHDEVREIVKQLVAACHRVLLKGDDDYDPDRCDRCVKSDCCTIDRIHLTDEERARILDWLEIEDTPG
ncbi:MAG: hypothetical protein QGG14_00210, partial [Planctomycetota bacterium]|nr:hypothetical protein [Planctomycetota bacterium]